MNLLRELALAVPPRSRALCLTESERAYLAARGLTAETPAMLADPRLLSPSPEAFEALSFGEELMALALADYQRMFAIAFRALAPGRGVLRLAMRAGESENAVGSLLRQNGFAPLASLLAGEARWLLVRRT